MLERGTQVLSATPGRLLDLLESGRLTHFAPRVVVLDEADEMLDMGFLEDIQAIFKHLPEERQTLLFSATMPDPIRHLAETILKKPVHIKTIQTNEKTSLDVRQHYYVVADQERDDAIARLMDDQEPEKAIVFCRTRDEVDRLHSALVGRGYNACSLHGDMDQRHRQEVMGSFRGSATTILVATDVAARGLDVPAVTHVFNYHLPFDSKGYIHRIGRTGRAGRKGTAITLVTPREFYQLERIRQQVGTKMEAKAVPCLNQLRLSRIGRLRETLNDMPLHSNADAMIEMLGEGTDLKTLAARLLSMIMAQQTETGPDKIGLSPQELEQLQRRPSGPRPPYRPSYRSGGPPRGGPSRNHRGGSGYGGGSDRPPPKRYAR
jgi:ATP-dependent RNA helicase DeaD